MQFDPAGPDGLTNIILTILYPDKILEKPILRAINRSYCYIGIDTCEFYDEKLASNGPILFYPLREYEHG
jgi:hypothetical protein